MPNPFPCNPVIHECSSTKTQIEKKTVEITWMEHNTPTDKSNPAKQLRDNIDHSFTCKVICNASNRKFARKILEACFIATMKPSINDKIDSDLLYLYRNGIT